MNVSRGSKLCLAITGQIVFYIVAIYILNVPVREKVKGIIIGGTGGHISTICDEEKAEKFSSVDFTKSTPTVTDYFFFDIQNPIQYLRGENADIVEKGPYVLKQYQVNFDINFKPSTLTASISPNPNGTIEFKVANAYVVLDADTELSSSLIKRPNSTLSTTDTNKINLGTQRRMIPSSLSMNDEITSLSPAYLTLLKGATSEFTLILSLMCSSSQIANIPNAGPGGAPQCSPLQWLDPQENACACCMLSDTYDLVALSDPNIQYTKCNDLLEETTPVMSTLSLLASYDGGVPIKSSGDPKFDGSGEQFKMTLYGQDKFYTPLIQTHSINDLMFGYPSALIGSLLAWWSITPAYLGMMASDSKVTKVAVAKMVLGGQLDGVLPIKVGNMARYTNNVGSVCSSTCSSVASDNPFFQSPLGWMCEGTAKTRSETSIPDQIALGGIDCKPFSATYATKMYCQMISETLRAQPNAPGFAECQCAGPYTWSESGCCLAGGMLQGSDMTGFGCLSPIPGAVDSNLLGKDKSDPTKLDIGQAIKEYINLKDLKSQSIFMCPVAGVKQVEQQKFDYYEEFNGERESVIFYDTGLPRIQIGDESNESAIPYSSQVTGGSGHYMPPTGLVSIAGGAVLTVGYPSQTTRKIFVGPAKRSFDFIWQFSGGLFPRSCGTSNCIPTLRFVESDDNFKQAKAKNKQQTGQGLPFDGLISLGHLNGIPVYLHQPFFMGGDTELYTQLNNSYVQAYPGNGINLYHLIGEYYTYTNSPIYDKIIEGGNNSNYQLVDKAWVEDRRQSFESYLDVESATGITLESRIRYGVSYSVWECNPQLNPSCLLSLQSKGQARCYKNFGQTFLSTLPSSAQAYLEAQRQDNFTFPCSAANVFTPNVVGGKIIPVYWASSSVTARPEDVDQLLSIGYVLKRFHRGYFFLIVVALYITNYWTSLWSSQPSSSAKTRPVS